MCVMSRNCIEGFSKKSKLMIRRVGVGVGGFDVIIKSKTAFIFIFYPNLFSLGY